MQPYWSSVWTRSPSRRGSFVLQPESSYCWCRLDRCRWIWSKATQRHTCQSRACRFRHVSEDYLVVPSGNLPNNCQYIFTLKHTFLQTFKIFEVSHFNDRWYDKCVNICECRHDFLIYIIFFIKESNIGEQMHNRRVLITRHCTKLRSGRRTKLLGTLSTYFIVWQFSITVTNIFAWECTSILYLL